MIEKTELQLSDACADTLIVGRGRVASHFKKHLDRLHLSYSSWDRSSDLSLAEMVKSAKRVLLLISDSAIVDFYETNAGLLEGKITVHFSAVTFHPGILGFHPLASFSPELDLDWDRVHFHGVHPESIFREALPMLTNEYHQLGREEMKLYHALCVVGGNFTALLWREFFLEMQKLGVDTEGLKSYFEAVSNNIRNNPLNAVTGPLMRKDVTTLKKNLSALSELPTLKNLYVSFLTNFDSALAENIGKERTNP